MKPVRAPAREWVPSVLLASLWAALWLAWPVGQTPGKTRHLPTLRNGIFRMTWNDYAERPRHTKPDVFILPASAGLSPNAMGHELPDGFSIRRIHGAKRLDVSEIVRLPAAAQAVRTPEELPSPARWPDPTLEPLSVLKAPIPIERKITVTPADQLMESGFRLPDGALTALNDIVKAWTIVVYVHMGEDGFARHVILEKPSDDPVINNVVTRTMYKATLSRAGEPREGRVTVANVSQAKAPTGAESALETR